MGHGAWGMGHGVWGMGHGAWGMGHGAWGMGHGAWGMGRVSVCVKGGGEATAVCNTRAGAAHHAPGSAGAVQGMAHTMLECAYGGDTSSTIAHGDGRECVTAGEQ
jgi:hypothetical protein